MPEQETAGPQPESALMYALRDAFRRDLDALLIIGASTGAVRIRWAIFAGQLHATTPPKTRSCGRPCGPSCRRARSAGPAGLDRG